MGKKKRVYKIEVTFRVTSLDISREEVPVNRIPRWKKELDITQESKIIAENLQKFNEYLEQYGIIGFYGDFLQKIRDIPK